MTQIEKVKAYDKALERARALYSQGAPDSLTLESIFPELRELEDEKIRKELIALVEWSKSYSASAITQDDAKRMIAWLKKQNEKSDEWKEGDVVTHGGILALVIKGRRAMKSNGEIFTIQYPDEWIKLVPNTIEHFLNELEKQNKQILANSAKTCKDEQKLDSYCQENCKGYQEIGRCFADGECEAKKSQHTWSEEDKTMSRLIGNAITADDAFTYLESKGIQIIDAHAWLYDLKDRVQPKQEWSEEDERMFNSALWHVKNSCGNGGRNSGEFEVYNWLKSIKDRVQPKQEWSEEDEAGLGDALWAIRQARTIAKDENDMGNLWYAENWLKSLKERVIKE